MTEFRLSLEALAAVFLAGLIFVSMLHYLQLGNLSKAVGDQQSALASLKEGLVAAYSAPQAATPPAQASQAQAGQGSLPKNLQNLPNMVGGC